MIVNNIDQHYDVIIVGSGFAGLSAAYELEKLRTDLRILILEADDEIGGRSFNKYLKDGTLLELGGQWVGFKHKEMLSLIKQFNLTTYVTPPFVEGKTLYFCNKKICEFVDQEFYDLAYELDKMASTIDLTAPWTHPQAQMWDNITFEAFIEQYDLDRELKKLFTKTIVGGLLSTEPDQVSLLQTLTYIESSGGFDFASSTINGAQNYRILGGVFQVANKMADALKQTTIVLDEEVVKLTDNHQQVVVTTKTGKTYQGKTCVLALSPVVANKIVFTNPLPKDYQNLLKSYRPGRALKVNFTYQTPFWHKDNKSGFLSSNRGWITEIADNSTPNSKKGILTAFIYGKKREAILKYSLSERKKLLIAELVNFFGPAAKKVETFSGFNWQDNSWTGGCFSATLKPGALVKYGQYWRQPVGLIHFAGTETSPHFYGYFEGAVLSGKRVAHEILTKLK